MEKNPNIIVRTKTTHIETTPALEDYINKKMHLLEKHLGFYAKQTDTLYFDIEVSRDTKHHKQGDIYSAEINFTAGSTMLRSKATNEDLYAAIDEAKDDLARELRQHANKRKDLWKRGGRKIKEIVRGWRRNNT